MKLGIDFGTTNCTVGYLRPDGHSMWVSEPIPSVGVWRNGKMNFGANARRDLRSGDQGIYPIRNLKMSLGKEDSIRFGQHSIDTIEIASKLIEFLLKEAHIDDDIEGVVLATPVQASRKHREALREAASRAGLENVTLVYEPTAALIGAQRFEVNQKSELYLVVDWGGGTLDVAVIDTDGRKYKEHTVGGDIDSLGGAQIDKEITMRVLESDAELRLAINKVPNGEARLQDEVEDIKLDILNDFDGRDGIEQVAVPRWLGMKISLKPEIVFNVIDEFAEKAAKVILSKLSKGGVDPSRITYVLFAGGVSQLEEVQTRIMQMFINALKIENEAGSNAPIEPQTLTGRGCIDITSRQYKVSLSTDFGLRQSDDSICKLLDAGTSFSIDRYRQASFMVTDTELPEAYLDFGLTRGAPGKIEMVSGYSGDFESFELIKIPVVYKDTDCFKPPDYIDVFIGVDENLSISIEASSRRMDCEATAHITGIPLILEFSNQ